MGLGKADYGVVMHMQMQMHMQIGSILIDEAVFFERRLGEAFYKT